MTTPPPAPPRGPRRFASLTRTIDQRGCHVVDAIDTDGRAWWRVILAHDNEAPVDWFELTPLPTYEDQP